MIKITVPMPLNLANSRMHWRAKHREKLKYWETLDIMAVVGQIPMPPPEPLNKVTVTSHMILGASMDDDNAMARHKWVLDWLKTRGYIEDDKRKCLTWGSLPAQEVSRKTSSEIILTLTPIQEGSNE